MMNRLGLERFKKAQSAEPFSVKASSATLVPPQPDFQVPPQPQGFTATRVSDASALAVPAVATSTLGAGGSHWQPPDWAVDPKAGVYWLDVLKDGEVVDKISLDRRRCIFGRQSVMCDIVLDHPSVSRQHAAIVQHKNGGIYVIDQGSVHGTFVANERLTKDNPVELEVGQSLRFAASTRIYVLRKSVPTPVVPVPPPTNIVIPPPPDASDEEAVLAHNTLLNRLGVPCPTTPMLSTYSTPRRPVVGISDGADVSTEPGPIGVREGSLVGKYESLVKVTVIPKGHEDAKPKAETGSSQGVTQRLKQYLEKVKAPGKGGLYGDIYGESLTGIVGGSWANAQNVVDSSMPDEQAASMIADGVHKENKSKATEDLPRDANAKAKADIDEDLFGDEDDMLDAAAQDVDLDR
ncbi:hypothetical protein AXG93_4642s1040 [Marchantia polymorpha subsp. ruderalis]|uniref:FHA domain-containing protein n=1 Tax=Marchantia polymorpha subsp. ruderalis TaxID=1480154 RepID=A0A176VY21_MARPO|nr:hypothetical protein AXG93_4642s1040 [Marchantia polymorpha subsp. ruderalis]